MFIDQVPTPDIAVRTCGQMLRTTPVELVRSPEPRGMSVRIGLQTSHLNEVTAHSTHLIQSENRFPGQLHLFAAHSGGR
jgi:hypothetical protein